jgi:hypothetical protein
MGNGSGVADRLLNAAKADGTHHGYGGIFLTITFRPKAGTAVTSAEHGEQETPISLPTTTRSAARKSVGPNGRGWCSFLFADGRDFFSGAMESAGFGVPIWSVWLTLPWSGLIRGAGLVVAGCAMSARSDTRGRPR